MVTNNDPSRECNEAVQVSRGADPEAGSGNVRVRWIQKQVRREHRRWHDARDECHYDMLVGAERIGQARRRTDLCARQVIKWKCYKDDPTAHLC
jgi:hypothetical protein